MGARFVDRQTAHCSGSFRLQVRASARAYALAFIRFCETSWADNGFSAFPARQILPGLAELTLYVVIIFVLNVMPAFAPPTWMALSWIGFENPQYNPFGIALVGAAAATAGRVTLAKLARIVIRQRFMSDASRANIDVIKEAIEGHRALTAGTFLFFAFSPFASNFLFIAYGLTNSPIRLVAIPFFLGRFLSYSFFVFAASEISQRLGFSETDAKNYFGIYFVASQFVVIGALYLFAHIDWRYAVKEKRLRWLQTPSASDRS